MSNEAPVAVIGIGCRFPGDADTPQGLWELMLGKRLTSGPAPSERWQWYRDLSAGHDLAVQQAVAYGSYLSDIAAFDAQFFGLSPREAEVMDPQQRILLETTWQALEHAGIAASQVAGTETGVYVGSCTGDYGRRLLEDLPSIEAWTGIGAANCALANRISYALDLRGPSLITDTACSASLVAVHLACQALRAGDSPLAIAAGVNLVVSPGETISLGAAGALSPDGRCKPFDASADGYGRGEGCGVLVLKLLADAERDGDRVLAVIRGSSVNQDGRTNGIMAPNEAAQEQVMRRACSNAGVTPDTIDFVEAHGTGTQLGDPTEASALSAVYGADRESDDPCLIGSVKGNLGHLEGAAGVASLIKAVLALSKAEIPPSVIDTPTPNIPWDSNGLRVVADATPWPDRGHPRRAAVSGFGYGGTVAHLILEQAPVRAENAAPAGSDDDEGPLLFALSGASDAALAQSAAALADALAEDELSLASVAHTLGLRRSHLASRATVVAADRDELRARLLDLSTGAAADGVSTGEPLRTDKSNPVWVFSGHGSQWSGMGRDLLADSPVFAAVIDTIDPIFVHEIGFSPRDVLSSGDLGDGEHGAVDRIQTMIFAMQVGLAAVWRSLGVTPSAVIGHSVGEIAAAVTCGALTLEDGARLICRRSRLLPAAAGDAAMAMVGLSFDEVEQRLAGGSSAVSAAISASPVSTVVSGSIEAVEAFITDCQASGISVRRVASDVAFHSPAMDPLARQLAEDTRDIVPRDRELPMYLTAVPDPRAELSLNSDYWAMNLRNPVFLTSAVSAAAADGHRSFIEIAPHPVVAHSVTECLSEDTKDEVFVGWSLRRNKPELATILDALGMAHCNGVPVDWSQVITSGTLVDLPGVRWQHQQLWREPQAITGRGVRGHEVSSHSLLGQQDKIAGSAVRTWQTTLDDSNRPYPGSHSINGTEVVPAAVLVCTFLGGLTGDEGAVLTDILMSSPMLTSPTRSVQVVREGQELRLASRRADSDSEWEINATCRVGDAHFSGGSWESAKSVGLQSLSTDYVQSRLTKVGVPTTGFDWTIEKLEGNQDRLLARVRVNSSPSDDTSSWAPAIDSIMTVAPCVFGGEPQLRMAAQADLIELAAGDPPTTFFVEAIRDQERADVTDVLLADSEGRILAVVRGLRYPIIEQGFDSADDDEAGDGGSEVWGAASSPEELRNLVEDEVRAQIALELRMPETSLRADRPLVEQGMDSVMSAVIRRRLAKSFRQPLPATLLWQQPTLAALTDHLTAMLTEELSNEDLVSDEPAPSLAL